MNIKISLYFLCLVLLLTNIQVHGHAEHRQQRIKLGVGKYTASNQQHSSYINDVEDNRVFSPVPPKPTYQQTPIYRIRKNNKDNERSKKETSVVGKISRLNSKQLEIPTSQENRVEKLKLLQNNLPPLTQLESPPFVEKKIRKNSKQLQFLVNDEMINKKTDTTKNKIDKNSIKNKNGNKYTNNRVKNQKHFINRGRNQPFKRITNKRISKEQQERFIAYINRYVENALNRRQQQILELEKKKKNKPKTPIQAQQLLNKRVKMPLANNSNNNKMNNIKQKRLQQQQQHQNLEQNEKPATESINVAKIANETNT